jgi:DNA mismatch endonuclease (patch repair protein)
LGFRFRLHRSDLPGSPDLVFPGLKKVVFVHGCFWHRHPRCARTTNPKTRASYWAAKFVANVKRDKRNVRALRATGWDVLVIWECETFKAADMTRRLKRFLASRSRMKSKRSIASAVAALQSASRRARE